MRATNHKLTRQQEEEWGMLLKTQERIQQLTNTDEFNDYLQTLHTPKVLSEEKFTEGILAFTSVANMSSSERKHYFGSSYAGLHYPKDFAALWNQEHRGDFTGLKLTGKICPALWEYNSEAGMLILSYTGSSPSIALNQLLKGPTLIDCGMFCQLSIWFGMRYVLGDARFDQLFSHSAMHITQFNYDPITDPLKP